MGITHSKTTPSNTLFTPANEASSSSSQPPVQDVDSLEMVKQFYKELDTLLYPSTHIKDKKYVRQKFEAFFNLGLSPDVTYPNTSLENLPNWLATHKFTFNLLKNMQQGNGPLHLACMHSNVFLIALLLENNADLTIKNHFGQTPFSLLNSLPFSEDEDKYGIPDWTLEEVTTYIPSIMSLLQNYLENNSSYPNLLNEDDINQIIKFLFSYRAQEKLIKPGPNPQACPTITEHPLSQRMQYDKILCNLLFLANRGEEAKHILITNLEQNEPYITPNEVIALLATFLTPNEVIDLLATSPDNDRALYLLGMILSGNLIAIAKVSPEQDKAFLPEEEHLQQAIEVFEKIPKESSHYQKAQEELFHLNLRWSSSEAYFNGKKVSDGFVENHKDIFTLWAQNVPKPGSKDDAHLNHNKIPLPAMRSMTR